jgi:glucose/arabinose dehydrogenase
VSHRRALLGAWIVALACACGLLSAPASLATVPSGFQDTVAIDGLREPTTFRFAPDGRIFVAEKPGRILVFDNADDPTPTVFADLRKQIFDAGDRGLLGMVLDPDFPARPYVYALYSFDHVLGEEAPGAFPAWGQPPEYEGDTCAFDPEVDACPVSGRLVRLTAEGDHAVPAAAAPAEDVLVEDWCQQDSSHSVGDLAFGPEGALFASGGEGASFIYADYGQAGWPHKNQCGDPMGPELPEDAEGGSLRSQDVFTPGDPTGLDGSVIRIDPDTGAALPGNPLYGAPGADANAQRIIASGFRNPFRFSINSETDEVYVGNVGSDTDEEIDRFSTTPADVYNSGWPCFEGDSHNLNFQNLNLTLCEGLYDEPGSTSPPFFSFEHHAPVLPEDKCDSETGSAISGSAFYNGGAFPAAYDDALFFADPVRRCAYVMFAGTDGRPDPSTAAPFLTDGGLYPGVDFQVGPDGGLYYAQLFGDDTYEEPGSIHRVAYSAGNQPPIAHLTATPEYAVGNLKAKFDAGGSTDSDGETLSYEWDLEGDGTYAAPTSASFKEKEFKDSANHVVAVRVVDQQGAKSLDRVTVYPHDTPPEPAIVTPAAAPGEPGTAALHWRVGESIQFSGVANDKEDGTLLPTQLDWSSRLFHCPSACHAHPLQAFPSVAAGTLVAPDHDYPSHIDITFTAVDSRGLSASRTIVLQPRTVQLLVRSQPEGVTLSAGLLTQPGPIQLTSIEGSNVILSAPPTAQIGGDAYVFQGWSDGGARVHSLIANASATYTAAYAGPSATPVVTPPAGNGDGSRPPQAKAPTLPPRPQLTLHPRKRTASALARFEFKDSEAGVGYACKLDSGRLAPCRSPRVYRALKPGKHVFRVFAEAPGDGIDYSPATVFRWRVLAP